MFSSIFIFIYKNKNLLFWQFIIFIFLRQTAHLQIIIFILTKIYYYGLFYKNSYINIDMYIISTAALAKNI